MSGHKKRLLRISCRPVNVYTEDNNSFEKFQLAEYNNIAEAHHNTVNTITAFFKYYIAIVTVPIPVLILLLDKQLFPVLKGISSEFPYFYLFFGSIFSMVGFSMMVYILNLRFDALLYARTVNGIRNYYYKFSSLSVEDILKIKVLPTSIYVPRYYEFPYFVCVIFAFGIINSSYILVSFILEHHYGVLNWSYYVYFAITFLVFISHFIAYKKLSDLRDNLYLKSNIIGIDIDGVMNLHREHFCAILKKTFNKLLLPEKIQLIPVSSNNGIGVDKELEISVFHDVNYWIEMPIFPGVNNSIRQIKKMLNYKIYIYSNRPWPTPSLISKENWRRLKSGWEKCENKFVRFFTLRFVIERITKKWLNDNKIEYDKLIIENNNKINLFRNRFFHAKKRCIKYFIEDRLDHAKRLAETCDVVFLIDQPYNKTSDKLPYNIFRVYNWDEIVSFIQMNG